MRLYHSSDWHLGRTFYGVDVHDAHAEFVSHLLEINEAAPAAAVLISGDIYDRSVPPARSMQLWETAVSGFLEQGTKVIATSGNHDSFQRLGINRRQLDRAGLHLRTHLSDITRPVELTADGTSAVVYGIPYLEPALVAHKWGVERTHQAVLAHATGLIRAHAAAHHPEAHIIVMAHAFVTGAAPSESERAIDIGGVGNAGVELFSPFSYTALGHLHRPQEVAPNAVYPGTPLPLSFSEAATARRISELTIAGDSLTHEPVMLPEFLDARTLRGPLEELLHHELAGSRTLISAVLSDPAPVPGALQELRLAFPGLIQMRYANTAEPSGAARTPRDQYQQPDDTATFRDFMSFVADRQPTESEMQLFTTALAEAVRENS